MKVIGVVGSPRRGGNTEYLTRYTLDIIAEEGLETELLPLAGKNIVPCTGCGICRQDKPCPIEDDLMGLYEKAAEADGVILASPVYFGSATATLKAFMDRAGFIGGGKGAFVGKVGGPLVVARRAGQNFTHAQIDYWFHILGFYMPGSTYWNIAFGREKGDVEGDEEGLNTAKVFGKNMVKLLRKLNPE